MVTVYINSIQFYLNFMRSYIWVCCFFFISRTPRKAWKDITCLQSFPELLEHPNSLTLPSSPWIIQESAAYQENGVRHREGLSLLGKFSPPVSTPIPALRDNSYSDAY